ncbi:DUF6538 domain-containing protein [Bradyrhizobium sp. LMG 9283]|uniref:DUF6538 domain-containing protein n=1 Tax=Bradyrhizobium sp. LMG 9283 TaxID=592064 RepID=UPI00388D0687
MVVRMPAPVLRDKKSKSYWLRKRVPQRYRDIVGRGEVWRSLETEDERIATVRCASLSLVLESEWEKRLEALRAGLPDPVTQDLPMTALSPRQAVGLAGEYYREYVEKHGNDPTSAAYEAAQVHKKKSKPLIWHPNWQLFAYWDDILEFLKRKRLRLDPNSKPFSCAPSSRLGAMRPPTWSAPQTVTFHPHPTLRTTRRPSPKNSTP